MPERQKHVKTLTTDRGLFIVLKLEDKAVNLLRFQKVIDFTFEKWGPKNVGKDIADIYLVDSTFRTIT
jgi:hypothetical protein